MPFSLDIHGASKHLGTDVEYNEVNPGIGLTYEWQDDDITELIKLGQYLNSLNKKTNYIGYGVKKGLFSGGDWEIDAGIIGGLLTGYNDSVTPALLPQFTIGNGAFNLNILAAPEISGLTPTTIMFSTQIPFK